MAGTVSAYAAVDTEQSGSATVVTQQSVDNLPTTPNQVTTPSTATSQNKPVESFSATADVLPAQVAMVSGDYHKYEAMNWQNRGYSGGVKDLSIHYTSGDDVTIDASGSGILENGDYKGAYSMKKKDVGYVDVDFKQFRKYYDTYGGIYQGWSPSLSRDLFLDIGHFGIEAGITIPDLPNISVYYDHNYKDGSKSMLDWGSAAGITTKKIIPAWKEIKESVDTFGIKGDYTEKGYHFTGDQRWEISTDKTKDVEPTVSSATGPGNEIRQYFTTDTTVMTTMLGADKWYLNDKVFASSAYRFEHLKNDQVQRLATFNRDGGLTAASNPDGDGRNNQDVNSWVLNLMASPWSWLSGTGAIKAEVLQRDGESYYLSGVPSAGQAVPSQLKASADSNTYKLAESFGLRLKAIPRTAVYSDLSFEQSQNHLLVGRIQAATADPYTSQNRDAIIDEPVITWVTGADFQPVRFLNLTSQVRLSDKDMNFHDTTFRSTPVTGQVFLEKLTTRTAGFTQRATARLSGWAQTSVRYLFDNTEYVARGVTETVDEKANMLSNTFIYDLSVYPISQLSVTGSFSQLYSQTKTVASASSQYVQPFNSNSSTWMLATDYQAHKNVHLDSSLFYTLANNYSDNRNTSFLNYASAFDQLGVTIGCKWDINKDLSVKPQYGYQRYLPNERSGIGGAYDAQIVSLAITTTWG